jgi:hypothetical protein
MSKRTFKDNVESMKHGESVKLNVELVARFHGENIVDVAAAVNGLLARGLVEVGVVDGETCLIRTTKKNDMGG